MLTRREMMKALAVGSTVIAADLVGALALAAALALAMIGAWPLSARAQQEQAPGQGPGPVALKGQPTQGTVPPGQVGGPVLNHPELATPEHVKQETEAVKAYCRTHQCGSAVVEPSFGPGAQESLDRAGRAWGATHPGVADPRHTIQCETDPDHPNGPDLCYRASDHSRVYPGTPAKGDQ